MSQTQLENYLVLQVYTGALGTGQKTIEVHALTSIGDVDLDGDIDPVDYVTFKTKMGERLLAFLERRAGLAIVRADWLGAQRSGEPAPPGEIQ